MGQRAGTETHSGAHCMPRPNLATATLCCPPTRPPANPLITRRRPPTYCLCLAAGTGTSAAARARCLRGLPSASTQPSASTLCRTGCRLRQVGGRAGGHVVGGCCAGPLHNIAVQNRVSSPETGGWAGAWWWWCCRRCTVRCREVKCISGSGCWRSSCWQCCTSPADNTPSQPTCRPCPTCRWLARCVPAEAVFNDGFWEGLDVVVNALDNVNARSAADGAQLTRVPGGGGRGGADRAGLREAAKHGSGALHW